jgi:hypothetical protein
MNDAQRAANVKAAVDPTNTVAIYDDGLILYLAVSEETTRTVSRALGPHVTEEGRSDDGMFGCWLCRGLSLDEAGMLLAPEREWLDIGVADMRQHDRHTIDGFVELLP